jgi:hypothetical protein
MSEIQNNHGYHDYFLPYRRARQRTLIVAAAASGCSNKRQQIRSKQVDIGFDLRF